MTIILRLLFAVALHLIRFSYPRKSPGQTVFALSFFFFFVSSAHTLTHPTYMLKPVIIPHQHVPTHHQPVRRTISVSAIVGSRTLFSKWSLEHNACINRLNECVYIYSTHCRIFSDIGRYRNVGHLTWIEDIFHYFPSTMFFILALSLAFRWSGREDVACEQRCLI